MMPSENHMRKIMNQKKLLRYDVLQSLNDPRYSVAYTKYVHPVDRLFMDNIKFLNNSRYRVDNYDYLRLKGYSFFEDDEVIDGRDYDEMLENDELTAREFVYLSLNRLYKYEHLRRFKTPVELDINDNAYSYHSQILDIVDKIHVNRLSQFKYYVNKKDISVVLTTSDSITATEIYGLSPVDPDPKLNYNMSQVLYRVGVDTGDVGNRVAWTNVSTYMTINTKNWARYEAEIDDNINTTLKLRKKIKRMNRKTYTMWKAENLYQIEYEHILRNVKKGTKMFHNVNHKMFMMLQNRFNIIPSWRKLTTIDHVKHHFKHYDSTRFERYHWQIIESKPISYGTLVEIVKERDMDISGPDSIMAWHDSNVLEIEKVPEYTDKRYDNITDSIDDLKDDDLFKDWEIKYLQDWGGKSMALRYDPDEDDWIGENELEKYDEDYSRSDNKFDNEYVADKTLYKEHGIGKVDYAVNFAIEEEEDMGLVEFDLSGLFTELPEHRKIKEYDEEYKEDFYI